MFIVMANEFFDLGNKLFALRKEPLRMAFSEICPNQRST